MPLRFRSHQPAGALLPVVAVMADPHLSQHQPAKAALPGLLLSAVAVVVVGICRVGDAGKGVGRRPHADNRLAGLEIGVNMPHLLLRQLAEAGGDHHQIGVAERLKARDIRLLVGIDLPGFGIDRKHYPAVEAMPVGQDLGQLRQGLFAAVFLITADKHHPLALAWPLMALHIKPQIRPGGSRQRHPAKHKTTADRHQPTTKHRNTHQRFSPRNAPPSRRLRREYRSPPGRAHRSA